MKEVVRAIITNDQDQVLLGRRAEGWNVDSLSLIDRGY